MNREKTLISVIVPVYNAEAYIERCLNSILGQTYEALDIILVNDGSSDMSGVICDKYMEQDSRINVIHQINAGISRARNAGLDVARGDYVCFVDSDDYLVQDAIETLLCAAKECDADYVGGGFLKITEDGKHISRLVSEERLTFSGEEALYAHYVGNISNVTFVYAWGKLISKTVFKDLRFKEGIHYEDIHLMPYILARCNKVIIIPKTIYYYVFHEDSTSNNPCYSEKRYTDSFWIWQEHLKLYDSQKYIKLPHAVMCLILEKIFNHDVNHTIPKGLEKWSKDMFGKYFMNIFFANISLTKKFRLLLYKVLGGKGYRSVKSFINRKG